MADVMLILGLADMAMTFFGGQQKADSQRQEAEAKQRYYNALATAEEKKGFQDVIQIGRKSTDITGQAKAIGAETSVMAAAAGYSGQSLSDVQTSNQMSLAMDKSILQEAAKQALQSSQEKAAQYRLAGQGIIEAGKIGQELTWLDTAQSIASKWIPKGGGR